MQYIVHLFYFFSYLYMVFYIYILIAVSLGYVKFWNLTLSVASDQFARLCLEPGLGLNCIHTNLA